ncbi:MAG TPA: hypothetical protein VGA30_12160 [Actinomycetota bacterium]
MPKNWITVRVELLGGRDIVCDPPPGRVMLVGPRHSFGDLAVVIDSAFARWDLGHLHMFQFEDGRMVGEPVPNWDTEVLDESSLTVAETLVPGQTFTYIFDLGDEWRHACRLEKKGVDPAEAYGEPPRMPVPIWGWGSIPDQYGRRWEDDTGEDEPSEG